MDALGPEFWLFGSLTMPQNNIALALKLDWTPLRKTLAQAQSDTKDRKINGNVRWEKLCALGVLEVDRMSKDDVFVRRGSEWEAWAASRADLTHGLQMLKYGASVDDIL